MEQSNVHMYNSVPQLEVLKMAEVQELIAESPGNRGGAEMIINYFSRTEDGVLRCLKE